jgi:hypothetical protein
MDSTRFLHMAMVLFSFTRRSNITRKIRRNTFTHSIFSFCKPQHIASVWKSRKILWWLIDTGDFATNPSVNLHKSFDTFIQERNKKNPWCFDFIDLPSNYEPLLHDIKNENVLLVSDGSYHPTYHRGTAAWILEGTTSTLKISGKVITPGQESDQSTYHSELAGILAAILTVVNTLASFHNLSPSITLQCNCKKGVAKAFNFLLPATLQDSSKDLLKAIHYELSHSPVCWKGVNIEVHQDDTVSFNNLTDLAN